MVGDDDFEAMVDACCQAHDLVVEHGTKEMQNFSKALLHAVAKEVSRRMMTGGDGHHGG